jgi:PRC-barrel domain
MDVNRYLAGTAPVTHAGRSLLSEVLHWVGLRFAGYLLVMLGSVLAFFIWAVVYTYVWPGKPPPAVSIEAPAPPAIATPPLNEPAIVADPDPAPAVAEVPGDRIPEGFPLATYVYNMNSDIVGKIVDVLRGNDGKVDLYIVGIGDWFLKGSEKSIAVPSQKMTWVKGQDEWTAVVSMTKVDMQNAPKQTFDFDAKKWVPAQ